MRLCWKYNYTPGDQPAQHPFAMTERLRIGRLKRILGCPSFRAKLARARCDCKKPIRRTR